MGPGGYTPTMPKWDAKEKELHDKGIIPEPIHEEWDLRARNWFLGHRSTYDELTGDLVCSDGIKVPMSTWIKVVKDIKDGIKQFHPDREKDLLTLVLGNHKHTGRVRGLDRSFMWETGFPKDQGTYRSQARAKKRREEEEADKFNQLLARLDKQQQKIDELRGVA